MDYLSLFGLKDKAAVVTGAGSGIGAQASLALAQAGAALLCADIDLASAQATADAVIAEGGSASAIAIDVGREESIQAAFAEAEARLGRLDVLVNNAGIYPSAPFLETRWDEWDAIHNVNLRGVFGCMRAGIEVMVRAGNGGSIINMSSISSLVPSAWNLTPYAASKSGVNALTRGAALEFAANGIRVNAVMPGPTDTPGTMTNERRGKAQGALTDPGRYLAGRMAQPSEIAAAILFLACPAASHITGQMLAVDGGFMLT